jgi:hypothetical protein
MAYTAWSVVYGEQPTAAKWNQLGTNDAGFKDGTNFDNNIILTRHLGNAANLQIPQANLAGLAWQTFSPTWTNLSVGNGTVIARYAQIGKTTFFTIALLFGSTTSISGSVSASLPVNAASIYTFGATKEGANIGTVSFLDAGNQIFYGYFQIRSNDLTKADPMALVASGTYVSFANMQGTIPIALGNGDAVYITGSYEAA